ncbi:DUF262 domain-containing protein [Micromonospora sp. NPDC005220]|uniref:DUF262 domain-containing protein n=1 Tax=Micromonospora sp. NPDC005220 TaxID=3155589 RepID=UPI0033A2819F
MPTATPTDQRTQLFEQRRTVDFDTYDVTVDELLRRVTRHRIDVAPIYQRQFRWDRQRQSRLVESVLLGIPVPPLFMATNNAAGMQNQWEVVDGLQRLLTLVNFAGDAEARVATGVGESPLRLTEVEKLTTFEGAVFGDLPDDIRTTFEDRPLKVIVLNDKSDLEVRYDLFERLNTGGIQLTPHEIRECVFRGEFVDLLVELAESEDFKTVVVLPESRQKDGTPQEYVLRFFAYLERYQAFSHSVIDFLNWYMRDSYKEPQVDFRRELFMRTFRYLASVFPSGIRSRLNSTPVNLYEALSVGAALALAERPSLQPPGDMTWVGSAELRALTTGATNSRTRVAGRIEYCRDRFLEADA